MFSRLRLAIALSCLILLANLTAAEPAAKVSPQFTVWVFRLVNGAWVKADDRTLTTPNLAQAREYQSSVNRLQGWTATANTPQAAPKVKPQPVETQPAWYVVTVKSYDRAAGNLNVTLEPTGRSKSFGVGDWVENAIRAPGTRLLDTYQDPASIVGKRVLLNLGAVRPQFSPVNKNAPKLEPVLKFLREFSEAQPDRCERLWGNILHIETIADWRSPLTIGRLTWDEGVVEENIQTKTGELSGGLFSDAGPESFRHPDCLPSLDRSKLKLWHSPRGTSVIEGLHLVRFTPQNSALVRWPLPETIVAEIASGRVGVLEIMKIRVRRDSPQHDEWDGFSELPANRYERDSAGTLRGNTLEVRLPPGEYFAHCAHLNFDRVVHRFRVVAGEDLALPTPELLPRTYVLGWFSRQHGEEFSRPHLFYLQTERYYDVLDKFRLRHLQPVRYPFAPNAFLSRDKDRIRLLFELGLDVKIADLGAGDLKKFRDPGKAAVKWRTNDELHLEKEIAGFKLESSEEPVVEGVVGRSIEIRKGHVYRFDGERDKFLVEIREITTDVEAVNKLITEMREAEAKGGQ